jgi:hypothetical protein
MNPFYEHQHLGVSPRAASPCGVRLDRIAIDRPGLLAVFISKSNADAAAAMKIGCSIVKTTLLPTPPTSPRPGTSGRYRRIRQTAPGRTSELGRGVPEQLSSPSAEGLEGRRAQMHGA